MDNKHRKRRWTFIIRGMHVKTTTKCHFTPFRMAIIKTNQKITSSGKDVGKLASLCTLVGRKHSAVAVEDSVWYIIKLKLELPYDPAIPLLGLYPEELKAGLEEMCEHPCSQQHYSQQPSGGATQGPIDR